MSDWYTLDDKNDVVGPCDDFLDGCRWQKENQEQRKVAKDQVGKYRISTLFLGLDHSFRRGGPPLIFETMIFEGDGWTDLYVDRYSTWKEAEEGHKKAVGLAKTGETDFFEDPIYVDRGCRRSLARGPASSARR